MRIQLSLLLFAAFALTFTGCKDDEDNFTPEAISAANGWAISDHSVDYSALVDAVLEANDESQTGIADAALEAQIDLELSSLNEVKDCETDDTYFFNADGSTGYTDGGNDCDEDDGFASENVFENSTGWELNGMTLRILYGGQFEEYEVTKLTSSEMKITTAQSFSLDVNNQTVTEEVSAELVFRAR